MARKDGKAENQHTVPKMLLRNFGFAGRGRLLKVHVFDKQTDRVFSSGLDGVVAERGFYDFPESDASLEPLLAELENKTAAALEKLLSGRRFDVLNGEEAMWIATFVAAQYLRAKNFREAARDLDNAIAERIKRLGGDPNKVKGWTPFKSEQDVKIFALMFFGKVSGELAETLFGKRWVLFETDKERPFWISDNPVVLYNDRDLGSYGNIGFGVPGIQVYLPLSPTLMLGLWCPTHEDIFKNAAQGGRASFQGIADRIRAATGYRASVDEVVLREFERAKLGAVEVLLGYIYAGRPTPASAPEVMFFNSLQVLWAERYLISSQPDFDLAQEMIAHDPERRRGARLTI